MILKFVNSFFNHLFGFPGVHSQYNPIIPPKVQLEMKRLGISMSEIIGAFNSKNIVKGRAPNSSCGIAHYYGRVIGAIYRKDPKTGDWVIIGCWAYNKKTSDSLSGRRYWQSWSSRPPGEKR